eukprot:COSAG01_NODE_171_length_23132_cov_53.865118_1_plen_893_part_10
MDVQSFIARTLDKKLGALGFGKFRREQISAGIKAGEIQLDNVQLTNEVFERVGAPVTLMAGCAACVRASIPWISLLKAWARGTEPEPIVVEISDVFACIRPNTTGDDYDPRQIIRAALDADEAACLARQQMPADSASSSFAQKVADTMRVTLRHVHLRYEHQLPDGSPPLGQQLFAAGVTVGCIAVTSDPEHSWQRGLLRKVIQLGDIKSNQDGLGIYCSPGAPPFSGPGSDDWMTKMGGFPQSEAEPEVEPESEPGAGTDAQCKIRMTDYILKPLPAQIGVTFDKSGGHDAAFNVSAVIGDLDVDLEHNAVRSLAAVDTWAQNVATMAEAALSASRSLSVPEPPQPEPEPGSEPEPEPEPEPERDEHTGARVRHEQEYVQLYAEHCGHRLEYSGYGSLSVGKTTHMKAIEDVNSVSTVKAWRRKALQRLRSQVTHKQAQAAEQSWSSKMVGWVTRKAASAEDVISQEQLDKLVAAIEDEPIEETPVHTRVDVASFTASVKFRHWDDPLAVLQIDDINGHLDIQGALQKTQVGVGALRLLDRCSPSHEQLPELLSTDTSRADTGTQAARLLSLDVVKQSDARLTLGVVLQPLKFIYNPHLTERLLDFGQRMSQLGRLAVQLGAAGDGVATADQLVGSTSTRQVLDLTMTLHAPTILIPDDCAQHTASPCLRMCLGDVKLRTETETPNETQDIFIADITDVRVDMCDIEGSEDATRRVLSHSAPSKVIIKKRITAIAADRGVRDWDVDAKIPRFEGVVSDELLISLTQLVSSVVSQRGAALEALASSGQSAGAGAGAGAEELLGSRLLARAGSAEIRQALSVEFEGLCVSLERSRTALAELRMEEVTVGAQQSHAGVLTAQVGVGALRLLDRCSPSHEQLPELLSTDTSRADTG